MSMRVIVTVTVHAQSEMVNMKIYVLKQNKKNQMFLECDCACSN